MKMYVLTKLTVQLMVKVSALEQSLHKQTVVDIVAYVQVKLVFIWKVSSAFNTNS